MATEPVRVEDARLVEMARMWLACLRPPRRLPLSEWSAAYARLPDGSRYRAFPYQTEIMNALTDPRVRQVTVKKSARVGWSKVVQNFVAYTVHKEPRHVLIFQPTIADAQDYSKTDLTEALAIPEVERYFRRTRDGANSIRLKLFPGGSIRINGANSPAHFRRVHADVVILEEPDAYPPAAGLEGDQVELAWRRLEASTAPLRVAGSTPTIAGLSRVDALFADSTQERRWVPCPHCGTMMVLQFGDGTGEGLRYTPKDRPEHVHYVCPEGCVIGEEHKAWMDENGEWRAEKLENWPHRGFHINSLYSQLPGASWLEIARAFVRAKKDPQKLRVFINQTLGETFEIRGEAPPWRALYDRREHYGPPGTVPNGALVLTAAVDVQGDRLEFFLWGWGRDGQSWLVDHIVMPGSPYAAAPWQQLREEINRPLFYASGVAMGLAKVAIDAGYATTEVAKFVRASPRSQVIPVRGARDPNAPPIANPRAFDLAPRPGANRSTLKVYMIGDHILKSELYGRLALPSPLDGEPYPAGFIHLPDWADDVLCQQLTAEEWAADRGVWIKRGSNEALDAWKYSRAAAIAAGVDRMRDDQWEALAAQLNADQGNLFGGAPVAPPGQAVSPIPQPARKDEPASAPAPQPAPATRPAPQPRPAVKRTRSKFLA